MPDDAPPEAEGQEARPAGAFQAELRVRAPEDYRQAPYLYANYVQTSFTPHEITLHFSDYMAPIGEPPDGGVIEVVARPLVSVALPVNLIRPLVRLLESQVDLWETNFGGGEQSPEGSSRDPEAGD